MKPNAERAAVAVIYQTVGNAQLKSHLKPFILLRNYIHLRQPSTITEHTVLLDQCMEIVRYIGKREDAIEW